MQQRQSAVSWGAIPAQSSQAGQAFTSTATPQPAVAAPRPAGFGTGGFGIGGFNVQIAGAGAPGPKPFFGLTVSGPTGLQAAPAAQAPQSPAQAPKSQVQASTPSASTAGVLAQFEAAVSAARSNAPRADFSQLSHINSDYANWIIPGRLMAGPSPTYSSYYTVLPSPAEAEAHLETLILRDGIDTFVSLQNQLVEHTHGGYDAQASAIGARRPSAGEALGSVQAQASTAPTSLHPVQCVNFPVPDCAAPDSMRTFLVHMEKLLRLFAEGRTLYVHCAAGRGRTGLYACALLNALYPRELMHSPTMSVYLFEQTFHMRRKAIHTFYGVLPGVVLGADAQRDMLKEFNRLLTCI